MVAAMKHMALNFVKLDKFDGVDFRRWQKKMHFLVSSLSVVYVLTTPMLEDGSNNPTVEQDTLEAKYMAEDASSKKFLVSCIIDKLPPLWKDFKHTLKLLKEELTLVELGSHLRIKESHRAHDNDKPKGNNVAGPSVVNMCGKPGHLKKDCKAGNVGNKANGSGTKGLVDGSSNSLKGAIMHVCKDRCWFKTYESLNDGSILHMGNESTALVHGRGCVDLRFSSGKIHARLGHVHFKRMQDMSKDGLISAFDMETEKCKTCMLTKLTKKPFQIVKRKTKVLELIHSDLCDLHVTPSLGNKKFRTDRGGLSQGFWGKAMAVVRLPDPKLKTLDETGIECIFVGYDENSKAFRFSSVPRPSQRYLVNGTEDSGGSVVPKKVTDEVVQQLEPEHRKSKRHRTPKDFRPEFQLYLIKGTKDDVSDQHSYCFNVEDDPKTFDDTMKS
ncbi:zinc finger, CCHC-type containing protein [Tanacetum coccineum]